MAGSATPHAFAAASFAPMADATSSLPASGVTATAGLEPLLAPPVAQPGAQVLTVGQGEEFSTIAAAVAAAQAGDVIEVQAGTYLNDFATISAAHVTLVGVGGMVDMVATVPPTDLKGILTVDNDATIENFSFSGAAISDADGGNAAGIRYEGGQMLLENDSFSDNQNGVMGSPVMGLAVNTVTIDHCVFASNGSGSGYTHNLYMGAISSLVATNDVFEFANVGHEFKSRAMANTITGNYFYDGPTGTASYDIDLPDGGNDTVSGNVIEKGPDASNIVMVHFGGEGVPYAGSQLTISGNQFQNDMGAGVIGLLNNTAISASITGNAFVDFASATIASGPATETGNVDGNGTPLPDSTLTGVLPGNTLVITDANPHDVTLGGSIEAVEGGAGLLTVYAPGGAVVAIGGSGGMDYTESSISGGNQITTAAGSVNSVVLNGQDLLDSEGTDTIQCGAGNVTALVNGNATIGDGTGNNSWTVNGTATITGQGGNPVVNAGATADVTIGGTLGYLAYSNNGGNAAIDVTQGGTEQAVGVTCGALSLHLYQGLMNIVTAAGTNGATLRFGVGSALLTSGGDDTIYAGAGALTVIAEGAARIYAGSGTLAVYGRGNSGATLYGNGGTYLIGGDTGGITYVGGSLASTLDLQLASNTIEGGSGQLTVDGGSDEQITGGSGGLVYDATDSGGGNTITTQVRSSNTLTLAGPDVVSSWGRDVIDGGTGNQSMAIHGHSTVDGSTGNSSLTFYGTDTLVGRGVDSVAVESGADLKVFAGTHTAVTEAGGVVRFHILDASGNTTARAIVTGGSASVVNNPDGSIAIDTGSGSATQVAMFQGDVTLNSNGNDMILAGGGTDTVTITAANCQVWGGSGALVLHDYDWNTGDQVTVHGGSGTLQYDQGPGKLVFIGGTGTASINGEYGSLAIQGGSGSIDVTGGNLGVQFTGGTGNAALSLTPGGGTVTFGHGATSVQEASYGAADVYNFLSGDGGGTDVIAGFRAGVDQLVFQGVTVASEQSVGGAAGTQVQSLATGGAAANGGTILTLSDGTHVDLAGFSGQLIG